MPEIRDKLKLVVPKNEGGKSLSREALAAFSIFLGLLAPPGLLVIAVTFGSGSQALRRARAFLYLEISKTLSFVPIPTFDSLTP
jgi:hypothetical protein